MELEKNENTSVEVVPREGQYEDAVQLFRSLGIEPAVCGVGSFSIELTVERLEDLFSVRLRRTENSLVECVYEDGKTGWEFPVERLGAEAQSVVKAVCFTPIDFGPVSF